MVMDGYQAHALCVGLAAGAGNISSDRGHVCASFKLSDVGKSVPCQAGGVKPLRCKTFSTLLLVDLDHPVHVGFILEPANCSKVIEVPVQGKHKPPGAAEPISGLAPTMPTQAARAR